ncbi:energy transducer TonB [Hymenobacter sp. B1770]|uniref:energy transducer TonB n=1 Tax=Hymenobacter sp. B1770 TaxID=1718788 RepID=UPI003CF04C75
MKLLLLLLTAFCFIFSTAEAQKKPAKSQDAHRPVLEQGATTPDGKRIGKWNFYTRNQELELTFDYDSSRISFMQADTTRYLVRVGEEWQLKRMARVPHLLGSTDHRLLELTRNLRYPVSALQRQLQGTVIIGYTVDVNGHSRDYTVENSMSPDCDQEVWRALQKLPDNWIPAVYLNRPTATRFYLAVKFMITDEAALRREQQRSTEAPAGLAAVPSKSRYAHEVIVTAMAVERQTRIEQRPSR